MFSQKGGVIRILNGIGAYLNYKRFMWFLNVESITGLINGSASAIHRCGSTILIADILALSGTKGGPRSRGVTRCFKTSRADAFSVADDNEIIAAMCKGNISGVQHGEIEGALRGGMAIARESDSKSIGSILEILITAKSID